MSRPPTITKTCGRCERPFHVPNIRTSSAREKTLVCYTCPFCFFSPCDPSGKSGRCLSCSVPFSVIDHHAKGKCKRCYEYERRSTPPIRQH